MIGNQTVFIFSDIYTVLTLLLNVFVILNIVLKLSVQTTMRFLLGTATRGARKNLDWICVVHVCNAVDSTSVQC